MHNHNSIVGHVSVFLCWAFYSLSPAVIPGVAATLASIMAIINYYYSIKKNRNS